MRARCGLWALGAVMWHSSVIAGPALSGCASHTPPFVLMKDGRGDAGYSVELLQYLASRQGRDAHIVELPWARCLLEVKNGKVDVAIDAYDDVERRKTFLYTAPYHVLTPQVFYRADQGSKGLPADNVAALKRLQGCGVHEYTYEHYDLDAHTLDLGARDDWQLLSKLVAGRCDYAVEELEYIVGGRNYHNHWLDESALASFRPSWARGPSLHLLIGIHHPQARQLQQQLNDGIDAARKSGVMDKLRKRYLQAAPKTAAKG